MGPQPQPPDDKVMRKEMRQDLGAPWTPLTLSVDLRAAQDRAWAIPGVRAPPWDQERCCRAPSRHQVGGHLQLL